MQHIIKKTPTKKKTNKVEIPQIGGRVLGIGADGCVLEPFMKCEKHSINYEKDNFVSKIIDISDMKKSQYSEFIDEFKLGQKFKKIDPMSLYFLPGDELCIMDKNKLTKEQKDDIVSCKLKYLSKLKEEKKYNKFINITMPRGYSPMDIFPKLNRIEMFQSLLHLVIGASRMIYENNMCMMDIKPDNILYKITKDIKGINLYLHPVFIDFSSRFVIETPEKFEKFLEWSSRMSYYPILPPEILIYSIVQNFVNKNETSKFKKFQNEMYKYHGFTVSNKHDLKYGVGIYNFINKTPRDKYYMLYDKFLVYQIGLVFKYLLQDMKKDHTMIMFDYVVDLMTSQSMFERPSLDEVIELIFQKNKNKKLKSSEIKLTENIIDKLKLKDNMKVYVEKLSNKKYKKYRKTPNKKNQLVKDNKITKNNKKAIENLEKNKSKLFTRIKNFINKFRRRNKRSDKYKA